MHGVHCNSGAIKKNIYINLIDVTDIRSLILKNKFLPNNRRYLIPNYI